MLCRGYGEGELGVKTRGRWNDGLEVVGGSIYYDVWDLVRYGFRYSGIAFNIEKEVQTINFASKFTKMKMLKTASYGADPHCNFLHHDELRLVSTGHPRFTIRSPRKENQLGL